MRRERQVLLSQREEYHQSVLDKFGLQGWRTAEIPPTEIEEYPDALSLSQVRNLRIDQVGGRGQKVIKRWSKALYDQSHQANSCV